MTHEELTALRLETVAHAASIGPCNLTVEAISNKDGAIFLDVMKGMENRAEWKLLMTDDVQFPSVFAFEGFGGENTLTIFLSGMQDGTVSFHIVRTCVDNPVLYVSGMTTDGTVEQKLNEALLTI